jgi:putative spermidine/putrescine transport system substrate-binding protein
MDRRLFLQGMAALALGSRLTGCRNTAQSTLQVALLSQSIPSQLVGKFRQQNNDAIRIALSLTSQPERIFELLQEWTTQPAAVRESSLDNLKRFLTLDFNKPAPPFRMASLGDYWLTTAIQQALIRPLSVTSLTGWQSLEEPWRKMVQRDSQGSLAQNEEIWGAPYRWGATVIGYRKDKFRTLGWTPTDWADLWKPELKQRFSMLAQPREGIGLTLKKLGYSYNEDAPEKIAALKSALRALDQQVKFYSSKDYLQPLILGDTWLAVGWSTDLLPVAEEEPDIEIVVPKSGTALWADCWVWPKQDPTDPAVIQKWIDFWWQSDVADALSQFSDALSPVFKGTNQKSPAQKLLSMRQDWFTRSEFLDPLSEVSRQEYQRLWTSMRT